MKITDQVWEFAEPLVKACGCSLWDVEYVREGGEWFLRLYLRGHRRLRGRVPRGRPGP